MTDHRRRFSTGILALLPFLLVVLAPTARATSSPAQEASAPDIRVFFQAASSDEGKAEAALERIAETWRDGHAVLLVELARLMPSGRRSFGGARPAGGGFELIDPERGQGAGDPLAGPSRFDHLRDPRVRARRRIIEFLEERTGQDLGNDIDAWRRWLWSLEYDPHPQYAFFKGQLYGAIDERFRGFFPPDVEHTVRLDEIDWGGVSPNGIPPLDHPELVGADEAGWLGADDVVFGFVLNGEARAYPKRVLAWHELLLDRVGGVEVTVVYCTLCGTVIPYRSEVGGRVLKFGTSGLLYQSNKLMFDHGSGSLWSSLTGEPVVGPAVGSGLRLEPLPVVTTVWREWRAAHPDTGVLSRATGFERDYSEGAAYREYFASDELMFPVSRHDDRLGLKDEVLALRLAPEGAAGKPEALAIDTAFLRENPVLHAELAGRSLVVVTSPEGANRVFESRGRRFTATDRPSWIRDQMGNRWQVTESALIAQVDPTARLPRVPAFRAFWFGWYAQHPETRLLGR